MAEPHTGYERRDVSARGWRGWPAGWFSRRLSCTSLLWLFDLGLYRTYPGGNAASRIGKPGIEPPPPRLQSSPAAELQELRAAEDALLSSYGWVNREAGVIHIPIERAMELIGQRGLPSRQQTQTTTP